MGTRIILLALGLAVGLGVGMFIGERSITSPPPDRDTATLQARITELTQADADKAAKLRELEERIMSAETARVAAEGKATDLEARLAATEVPAEPVEPGKPTTAVAYADIEKALGKLGQNFQAHMFGNDEELAKEIQDLFAKASSEDIAKFIEKYHATTGLGPKTVMSHFLALSHHPDALKALEDIVRDKDQNMMERRLASHGLAFSGAESMKPLLRELAKEDPDRGTRANSAFGLYRMDDPEGVNLYLKATDEAFAEKDPLAVGYLSGLQLMDERALPGIRERVVKYDDWQAKITLISILGDKKDRASLNLLTELSRDEAQKQEVRDAAQSAIKAIEATE